MLKNAVVIVHYNDCIYKIGNITMRKCFRVVVIVTQAICCVSVYKCTQYLQILLSVKAPQKHTQMRLRNKVLRYSQNIQTTSLDLPIVCHFIYLYNNVKDLDYSVHNLH